MRLIEVAGFLLNFVFTGVLISVFGDKFWSDWRCWALMIIFVIAKLIEYILASQYVWDLRERLEI